MNQHQQAATTPEPANRILVALDASPQSLAALRAATQLAAQMEVELEGIFVEDINLLHLCGFPFGREIGSYTALIRRVDNRAMERQLRAIARGIRQSMASVADPAHVRWSFRVRRGAVTTELLTAAQSAALMTLGRAGQSRRRELGATARAVVGAASRPVLILDQDGVLKYPLTVLYTGTTASVHAVRLAMGLTGNQERGLRILLWAEQAENQAELIRRLQEQVQELLAGRQAETDTVRSLSGLLNAVRTGDGGTLVLPREHAGLLSEHGGPTILVP